MDERILRYSVSVATLVAGAAVGYIFAEKRLKAKYVAISEEEIKQAKEFYAKLNKSEKYSTPQELIKAYEEGVVDNMQEELENSGFSEDEARTLVEERAVIEEQRRKAFEIVNRMEYKAETEPEKPKKIVKNIWEAQKEMREASKVTYDLEEEMMLLRTPTEPYIVTEDEFMANANEYEQISLTYYSEDDVLCDDKDIPLQDVDRIVGSASLTRFGVGSGDASIVYVWNERLGSAFEIALQDGSYSEIVLGFIEHSATPRRFRRYGDDE
jgi:hypothetical protein